MRLINADKLYEKTAEWEAAALENVKKHQYDDNLAEWNKWSMILAERTAFKFDVADAPTVEPEPKRGKWTPITNGRIGFECSCCHNYAPSYQDGVEYLSNFCPQCGAKME